MNSSRTIPVRKEDGKVYEIRWMVSSLKEVESLFLSRILVNDLVMVRHADIFRLVSTSPIRWKRIFKENKDVSASKRASDLVSINI